MALMPPGSPTPDPGSMVSLTLTKAWNDMSAEEQDRFLSKAAELYFAKNGITPDDEPDDASDSDD